MTLIPFFKILMAILQIPKMHNHINDWITNFQDVDWSLTCQEKSPFCPMSICLPLSIIIVYSHGDVYLYICVSVWREKETLGWVLNKLANSVRIINLNTAPTSAGHALTLT